MPLVLCVLLLRDGEEDRSQHPRWSGAVLPYLSRSTGLAGGAAHRHRGSSLRPRPCLAKPYVASCAPPGTGITRLFLHGRHSVRDWAAGTFWETHTGMSWGRVALAAALHEGGFVRKVIGRTVPGNLTGANGDMRVCDGHSGCGSKYY
jgi:hypothetical protein